MLIYTAFANHRRFLLDCGNLTLLPNGELMLDIANESFFNATAGVKIVSWIGLFFYLSYHLENLTIVCT